MKTLEEIKQIKSLHLADTDIDGGCGFLYLGGVKVTRTGRITKP